MAPVIAVIGDAALDVQVAPLQPMRQGGDVPASIRMLPGGQGANVAIRLARRGRRARLVTAIGDDAGGDLVRNALAADGVELRTVAAKGPTSSVVVLLDASGDRTMLSQRADLLGHGLERSVLAGATCLVVSGYVLLEATDKLELSSAAPLRVVLGCSLGREQATAWQAATRSIAPHLVVLSRSEAQTLAPTWSDPPYLSRELAGAFDAIVVVTHPGGAAAWIGDAAVEVAAPAAGEVVDTTGAGDAFAATLVANLVGAPWPPDAETLRRSMIEASTVATAVTGVAGAQGRIEGEE